MSSDVSRAGSEPAEWRSYARPDLGSPEDAVYHYVNDGTAPDESERADAPAATTGSGYAAVPNTPTVPPVVYTTGRNDAADIAAAIDAAMPTGAPPRSMPFSFIASPGSADLRGFDDLADVAIAAMAERARGAANAAAAAAAAAAGATRRPLPARRTSTSAPSSPTPASAPTPVSAVGRCSAARANRDRPNRPFRPYPQPALRPFDGLENVDAWVAHYQSTNRLLGRTLSPDLGQHVVGRGALWHRRVAARDARKANSFITLREHFGAQPIIDPDLSAAERTYNRVVQGDSSVRDYTRRFRDAAAAFAQDLEARDTREWFVCGLNSGVRHRLGHERVLGAGSFEALAREAHRAEAPVDLEQELVQTLTSLRELQRSVDRLQHMMGAARPPR